MTLVSVCIPTYNGAATIGYTVESVLAQTFDDFELVIVDDRSTDGTLDVVRSYTDRRIRLLVNEVNLGPVENWNRALKASSGKYVKLVCHDDILYPHCLELQVAALESASDDLSFAAGRRDVIDSRGRVIVRRRGLRGMRGAVEGSQAIRRAVRSGTNPFGETLCVLMRRTAAERCGGFRGHLPYAIDLDYWCRLLLLGPLWALEETVGAFRVVPTSWSHRIGRQQSAQTIQLFHSLREENPDVVRSHDVTIGTLRARALGLSRRLLYWGLKLGR